MPTWQPCESETADLLQQFIEQVRYERGDGAPMSVRVMTSDNLHYNEVKNEIWVEDTQDSNTEFAY